MRNDRWARYGAAAGLGAVVAFLIGSVLTGVGRPDFAAGGSEWAGFLQQHRTRIQIGCVFLGAAGPLLIWFLATVGSLARAASAPRAGRAAAVAYGCGLVFLALFLVDVTTLVVGALRPKNMTAVPELAAALQDLELLLMGVAAPLASGVLVAFAVLALRDKVIWPEWMGWLAAIAAPIYALRIGTLFTINGPFAADGVLGIWLPVAAFAGWLSLASLILALKVRQGMNGMGALDTAATRAS
jgi:hypothetical protein